MLHDNTDLTTWNPFKTLSKLMSGDSEIVMCLSEDSQSWKHEKNICRTIHPYIYCSICRTIYLMFYHSVCHSICRSVVPSIRSSIVLSVVLSI